VAIPRFRHQRQGLGDGQADRIGERGGGGAGAAFAAVDLDVSRTKDGLAVNRLDIRARYQSCLVR
jgi:hypothetical protein